MTWVRRNWLICVLAGLVLLGLGKYLSLISTPLINEHCGFGTGSNVLYERMVSEADEYLATYGIAHLNSYSWQSAKTFSKELDYQVRYFALIRRTPAEKTAAMHALMRSYGMKFAKTEKIGLLVLSSEREKTKEALRYLYEADLLKIDPFCFSCLIYPRATLSAKFVRSDIDREFKFSSIFLRVAWWPWATFMKPVQGDADRCPPLLP
ncbi:hypothetical protein A7A08_02835 [Methyloligella halotolerans]|uniref:Uncharacterized protein n=1 Tax=Methyloligella halotolerans TaxID=1177755 RepID=A0A1E2RVS3_9HYPH|nr:hypothetical protein A7A08_02835 [Methyloligella halotolerans]